MTIYQRPYIQRGRGLGSLLARLFKTVIPVASRIGKSLISSPITRSVGTALKDSAVETMGSLGADLLRGEDLTKTLDKNLSSAKNRVATALETSTRAKPQIKKRKTRGDLFDDE